MNLIFREIEAKRTTVERIVCIVLQRENGGNKKKKKKRRMFSLNIEYVLGEATNWNIYIYFIDVTNEQQLT